MDRENRWVPIIRDVLLSLLVVTIILVALWAYSGMWPPMVVIESGSMQHSHDSSEIGVIDTGDLTLVKSRDKVDRIVTWVEGQREGYRTYDGYGDVIVFHKNGVNQSTPVIHRALVWIDINTTTGTTFDVPSLGLNNTLSITFVNLTTYHTGRKEVIDLKVDLRLVLENFKGVKAPHGGYITKGDNNPNVDQISLYWEDPPVPTTERAEPVLEEWVVGVSRGELPWFGLMKLMFTREIQEVPANSWYNMFITCGFLIVLPILVDVLLTVGVPEVRGMLGWERGFLLGRLLNRGRGAPDGVPVPVDGGTPPPEGATAPQDPPRPIAPYAQPPQRPPPAPHDWQQGPGSHDTPAAPGPRPTDEWLEDVAWEEEVEDEPPRASRPGGG